MGKDEIRYYNADKNEFVGSYEELVLAVRGNVYMLYGNGVCWMVGNTPEPTLSRPRTHLTIVNEQYSPSNTLEWSLERSLDPRKP